MQKSYRTAVRTALAAAGAALTVTLAGCAERAGTPTLAPSATPAAAGDAHGGHGGGAAMGHGAHEMGTKGSEALKPLKGKEFDVAYLSQMIAHHEGAIEMAEQALKTATKEETKREARKVADDQAREIAQMTKWLREWYDTAPDAAHQALVREDMGGMMAMPVTSDAMFLEMMIPHHQGAIDISRLVPERTERAEMKELAGQIIKEQEAEIKTYHRLMGHGG